MADSDYINLNEKNMRKTFLLLVLIFVSCSLFSQETAPTVKTINNHHFEVMLGAAGGTDDTFWLSARAIYSNRLGENLMIGAGIEYFRIGMDTFDDIQPGTQGKGKSYFASMEDGFSFLVDFRFAKPLGKVVSFVGVVDAGMFTAGRRYEEFGMQIGLQPGFRFKLNGQGGLALNVRPSYKYLSGAGTSIIGLLVGFSF